jgi:Fic family protein
LYKTPNEANTSYLTISKLNRIHELATNDFENNDIVGRIRNKTTFAYNPFHPVTHAPPEHVRLLLQGFCGRFNRWFPLVEKMSIVKRKEFALSLIPRIVTIQPFMDGNKRTSRCLTNIVLRKMNLTTFEWDFSNRVLRQTCQRIFADMLMTGNLPGCVALRQRVSKFKPFKQSFLNQFYVNSLHCC